MPPQTRLPSAARLEERLALAAVVMRKWQGSAWRTSEAARPHTLLQWREGGNGSGRGLGHRAAGKHTLQADVSHTLHALCQQPQQRALLRPQPLDPRSTNRTPWPRRSPKEGAGRLGGRTPSGGQPVPRQRGGHEVQRTLRVLPPAQRSRGRCDARLLCGGPPSHRPPCCTPSWLPVPHPCTALPGAKPAQFTPKPGLSSPLHHAIPNHLQGGGRHARRAAGGRGLRHRLLQQLGGSGAGAAAHQEARVAHAVAAGPAGRCGASSSAALSPFIMLQATRAPRESCHKPSHGCRHVPHCSASAQGAPRQGPHLTRSTTNLKRPRMSMRAASRRRPAHASPAVRLRSHLRAAQPRRARWRLGGRQAGRQQGAVACPSAAHHTPNISSGAGARNSSSTCSSSSSGSGSAGAAGRRTCPAPPARWRAASAAGPAPCWPWSARCALRSARCEATCPARGSR